MFKSIANPKTLPLLHVWFAGVGLSGALGYQLSGVSPWPRSLVAALVPAALNLLLSRRLPDVTAWIFVQRRLAACIVAIALFGSAGLELQRAFALGMLDWDILADKRWLTLPLAIVAGFAFRQGFGRAAGPRHVGIDWLSRRARTNWLLAALILGLPAEPALAAGYMVAVAIGIGVHFVIRDQQYREVGRRRTKKQRALAAQGMRNKIIACCTTSPMHAAETTLVTAGIVMLSEPASKAIPMLERLCEDESLDDKLRAKAYLLIAKAYDDVGQLAQSTRALEHSAEFDPECPVTIGLLQFGSSATGCATAGAASRQAPVGALLAPRSAASLADDIVRVVYGVNPTFFQVAIGRFYCRRGNMTLAFEFLDRAVERDPASSIARLAMGMHWLARRERSRDDEFRKDAFATAQIHLHMCILLEQNENSLIARHATQALATTQGTTPRTNP